MEPFPAGPAFLVVVPAEYRDHEIRLFAVELGQIDTEVVASEFGLMEFVVEDRRLAEAFRENGGDLGHEVSFFSRKGERDAEAFGTDLSGHRPFFGIQPSTRPHPQIRLQN